MILHIHASVDWLAGNSIIGEYSYSWGIELELLLLKVWSIELKPGPTRRLIWDPADPGLEPGRVEKKTEKGKTRCDPADPTGWPGKTRSKTRLQPVDFFYQKDIFFIF